MGGTKITIKHFLSHIINLKTVKNIFHLLSVVKQMFFMRIFFPPGGVIMNFFKPGQSPVVFDPQ